MLGFLSAHLEPMVFCAQMASAFFDTGLQMLVKQRCEDENGTIPEEQTEEKMTIADFYMVFNMLVKLMPIIPAIVLGRIGDKGYRMVPIVIPLIGYALSRVLLILTIALDWPLKVMYAAPVLHGLCGGFSSYWAGVMALISVNTDQQDRSLRIMRIELVYGIAGFLGSLASGHLFNLYTVELKQGVVMSILSVVLYLLCLIYAFFVLKMNEQDRNESSEIFSVDNRDIINVALLFVGGILYDVAVAGGVEILNVYVLEEPLRWGAAEVGYGNAAGSVIFITSFLGVQLFTRCRLSDASMIMIGMLSFLFGIYFMTFVTTTAMYFLARSLMLFALIPMPIIRSLLSKQINGTSTGMTFTLLQLAFRLSGLATTPTYTKIYKSTFNTLPGFVFTLSSIITYFAVVPISIVGCRTARQETYERI
ncbi:solute carrier family 46 member 2 [Trichomycterus rosablanca]|uniref:solute carrier family 46 member 2 n=1 Tax=Trichomycterus rosablanca TaxID=2290929 RepID=UPI002F355EBE